MAKKYLRSNDLNWRRFRELYRDPSGMLVRDNRQIRAEFDGLRALTKRPIRIAKQQIQIPLVGLVRKNRKGKKTASLGNFVVVIHTRRAEVELVPERLTMVRLMFSPLGPSYLGDEGWFPCLGNIQTAVRGMIREKEFALVTDLLIEFLETG